MLRGDGVEGALLVRRRVQVVQAVRHVVHGVPAAVWRPLGGRRPHLDPAAVLDLLGDFVRVVAQEVEELEPGVVAKVGLDEAPDLSGVH